MSGGAGTIVVLNGPSSAGKTTLSKAIRSARPHTILALSTDDFYRCLEPGRRDDFEAIYPSLTDATIAAACALSRHGYDVIVDTVLDRPGCRDGAISALQHRSTLLVGLRCDLGVLEARERERGNRRIGLARSQHLRVHEGLAYELELDTSAVAVEPCVRRVLALLEAKRGAA